MRKKNKDLMDALEGDSHSHNLVGVPCRQEVLGCLEAPGTIYLDIREVCQLLVDYLGVEYRYGVKNPAHLIKRKKIKEELKESGMFNKEKK